MMKVAHRLCLEGFVKTVRGNGGGLRLAKHPSDMNVGDVVRKIESDFSIVGCFEPRAEFCRISSACLLRSALRRAGGALPPSLEEYSLQDPILTKPLLEQQFSFSGAHSTSPPA